MLQASSCLESRAGIAFLTSLSPDLSLQSFVRVILRTRAWNRTYNKYLNLLRGDGLTLVKCRHNGTSAAEKVFHLAGNTFQWNTGLFSKMKQGIQLSFTTDVCPLVPKTLLTLLSSLLLDLQRCSHLQERRKTISEDSLER
jgi:hypothetical protein